MKIVSVIIACYRNSATLDRAIKSALAQTYPAIEVIVINDCSPETVEIENIVACYPAVRYVRNNQNIGLAASRNVGLALAQGFYIALLDADDEYHPDKISIQLACAQPGVALTCGLINLDKKLNPALREMVSVSNRIFVSPNQIIYRNVLNGAGLFIEREILVSIGGFDSSLRSCEDFDLWLRLLSKGVRIVEIGQPLYFYFHNPNGLSKNLLNISIWETEAILRHAARMGNGWLQNPRGLSVSLTWILRQMVRSGMERRPDLTAQITKNIDALVSFYLLKNTLRFINKSYVHRFLFRISRFIMVVSHR